MLITEVHIKLMDDPCGKAEKLLAFASITLDQSIVIRDLKLIQGKRGRFVAMPSRRLTDRCPTCAEKNHLRARFCNKCGCRLSENRAIRDDGGGAKLHADVAHPIDRLTRERIEVAVNTHYELELERSRQPGYVPSYSIGELDNVA